MFWLFMLINKKPNRAPVHRSPAGVRSRRRRPEVLVAARTSGDPLHALAPNPLSTPAPPPSAVAELGSRLPHAMPSLLMFNTLSRWVIVAITAFLLSACASNDNPPCRRVSAREFMRPHTFKGIASDEFIGVSGAPSRFAPMKNEGKAFKKIWEFGLFHGWAVIWCPEEDLPKDYLINARMKPNRKNSDDHFIHE